MDNIEAKSALSPYLILDLTEGGCMIGGRLLADLGATVIKIESSRSFYENIAKAEIVRLKSSLFFMMLFASTHNDSSWNLIFVEYHIYIRHIAVSSLWEKFRQKFLYGFPALIY